MNLSSCILCVPLKTEFRSISRASRLLCLVRVAPQIACWLVACLTSQQHASVSQGRICTDDFTCCRTKLQIKLSTSRYTDAGPTISSVDPTMPGAWQGSHWSVNFEVTSMTLPGKKSRRKRDSNPGSSAPKADALTTRPERRWHHRKADVLLEDRKSFQRTRPK